MSLALIGCGKQLGEGLPDPSGRAVAITRDFTPVVMVILPGGTSLCTGTIVSRFAVLTAAHCVLEDGAPNQGRYEIVDVDGETIGSTYDFSHSGVGGVESADDLAILTFGQNEPLVDANTLVYGFASAGSLRDNDKIYLVGYGCNNVRTRQGSGVKRFGTNQIAGFEDRFIVFLTPKTTSNSAKGIIGPDNRAGSCFGDSGGPALQKVGDGYQVVGVTHAGGSDSTNYISYYVDVTNDGSNRNWLRSINSQKGPQIAGL